LKRRNEENYSEHEGDCSAGGKEGGHLKTKMTKLFVYFFITSEHSRVIFSNEDGVLKGGENNL